MCRGVVPWYPCGTPYKSAPFENQDPQPCGDVKAGSVKSPPWVIESNGKWGDTCFQTLVLNPPYFPIENMALYKSL